MIKLSFVLREVVPAEFGSFAAFCRQYPGGAWVGQLIWLAKTTAR